VTSESVLPLDPAFEHGVIVVDGALQVDNTVVRPGTLAYLGQGRDELRLTGAAPGARALLLGGVPFEDTILMWWNFVARTRAEIEEAFRDWEAASGRFGEVHSSLSRIGAPTPQWAAAG
jgi:redox-sensitive bicupin YhaK (pirin superfamily)